MDLLDAVYPVAHELLDRVDGALIGGGAPAGHPIWPLLRRLGALPGETVTHLAALTPAVLAGAGDPLRRQAAAYQHQVDDLPLPAAWRGPAAEAYADQWSALGGQLAGAPQTLAGRLTDTASYVDDVADWLTITRRLLAGALAECLGSAEAITLRGLPTGALGGRPSDLAAAWLSSTGPASAASGLVAPPTAAVRAAAVIGAHVLRAAAEALDGGQALADRWAGRLDELVYRPAATIAGRVAGPLEIG
jgi:hypothetical protein